VDYDELNPDARSVVYLLEGKAFDSEVALERGNFSYLMGCDLDFESAEVRDEVTAWGKWYLDTTGVDGLRLDAVKHISAWFFPQWLDEMERHVGRDLFVVGEYWTPDRAALEWYLDRLGGRASVFGVPLHYEFHDAGRAGGHYEMRRLLDGSLMRLRDRELITFVENHDSQPLQALESTVEPWFKPLAYAAILLRREGHPCIFYPDYYGAEYEDTGRDGNRYRISMPSHRWLIDRFLHARTHYAWGPQVDYADDWNRIGWTRLGDEQHPRAMAVLMSDGPEGTTWMDVGKPRTLFVDLTEHVREPVTTNEHGWGEFRCKGGSVSVWVQQA
jgi:alpha-amylase